MYGDGMTVLSENNGPIPQVAVVGTGYWGKNLVRNFDELGALKAVCDSNETTLNDISTRYPGCQSVGNFEEILGRDDIPGVAIATPAITHGQLVKQSLLAGKDVFVEKPLCLDVSEAEELVALARGSRRILMVGHLLWYHPAILKLKELVDSGELGRLEYIYSCRLNLGQIRREENILWSFAPHDISVVLGLVGEMPDQVKSQGGNYYHQQITDITVSLLSFPSGVRAHIFVSWLHPFKEQKLMVIGDRKMIVFDDVVEDDKLVIYPHTIDWKKLIPVVHKAVSEPVAYEMEEPLKAECRHFLECVRTRQRPRTDGEEGLKVLRVLQQCQEGL